MMLNFVCYSDSLVVVNINRKYIDYEQSLFFPSWSVEQNARDTQMTTRVTEGARRERRACTPLTKSEEKERLLAV